MKDALWGGGGTHRSWPGGGCKGFGSGGVSGRGTGPRDGANFATCVVFLSFLTRTKTRKMAFLKDALWGGGGYPPELAWGGGCKGFGSGGVSGRGTGPRDGANFAACVVFLSFLTRTKTTRMAFFEGCPVGWGGGTHRSWPGGRGGRPRALVAGEGWGGVGAMAVPKKGEGWGLKEEQVQGRGQGRVGLAVGRGVQGLRFRAGRW